MTREKEDELLARLRELRMESGRMIERIVVARKEGNRDEEAIRRLSEISRERERLTQPVFESAVA
jgi:hypothetical protein